MDTHNDFAQAPRVSDALRRGTPVTVTTRSGRELEGTICDREQDGLLMDSSAPDGDSGYLFLPWSSVEQVKIRDVAKRRVKFLQS